MSEQKPLPDEVRVSIGWPLRLTMAGIVAERMTFAFWPLWTILLLIIAALALGYLSWAPVELFLGNRCCVPCRHDLDVCSQYPSFSAGRGWKRPSRDWMERCRADHWRHSVTV